jgi:hypothetical protein
VVVVVVLNGIPQELLVRVVQVVVVLVVACQVLRLAA